VTLVQVLADQHAIHMTCDFRLTEAESGRMIQDDAHKLVKVGAVTAALVGVTGLAKLGGVPVGTWIARLFADTNPWTHLEALIETLRSAAEPLLAGVPNAHHRRTTFVMAGYIGTQSRIHLVSNFESFVSGRLERRSQADDVLSVSTITPKGPIYLSTGVVGLVPDATQQDAKRILRGGAADETVQMKLADINASVARKSPFVSEGCYAASIHATGRGSSQAFLTDAQDGEFIPPEAREMLHDFAGSLLPRQGGAVQIVKSGWALSWKGDAYFRAQLKLEPNSAEVWNNYGADLAGRRRQQEARKAYERACELDPTNPIPRANLAALHARAGNIDEAERLYSDALDLYGEEAPALVLADYAEFVSLQLMDAPRATHLFERACRGDGYSIAKVRYALHILRTGGSREAAEVYGEAALSEDPRNPEVMLLAGLAEFHFLDKRISGRKRIELAAVQAPHNARTLQHAAGVCLLSGDAQTAAYYYPRALRHGATGWEVEADWGLALLLTKKLEGALRHLNRARRIAPVDQRTSIDMNIAATYWAMGRHEEAKSILHRVYPDTITVPTLELEAAAMLMVAGETHHEQRINDLLAAGAQTDGLTLIGMSVSATMQKREEAESLARRMKTGGSVN
jgi:Tfp pilus assembly protein PilF